MTSKYEAYVELRRSAADEHERWMDENRARLQQNLLAIYYSAAVVVGSMVLLGWLIWAG